MGRRHRRSRKKRGRGRKSGSSSSSDSESKYAKCGCKRKDGRRSVKEKARKSELARKMPRYPDGRFKSKWADFDFSKLRMVQPLAAAPAQSEATSEVKDSKAATSSSTSSSSRSEINVPTPQTQQIPSVKKESETKEPSTSSGNQNEIFKENGNFLKLKLTQEDIEKMKKLHIVSPPKVYVSSPTSSPPRTQPQQALQSNITKESSINSSSSGIQIDSVSTPQTQQQQKVPSVKKENETKELPQNPSSSGSQNQNSDVQIPQLPNDIPAGVNEMIAKLIAQAMKEIKDGGTAVNGAEPKKDKDVPSEKTKTDVEVKESTKKSTPQSSSTPSESKNDLVQTPEPKQE